MIELVACPALPDKKRGEIRAVDNVNFTCQPGKIYGLWEPTRRKTPLRMLATILEPTDGTAIVCGHDVVEQPEKSAQRRFPSRRLRFILAYFAGDGRILWPPQRFRRSHAEKKRVDDIFQSSE